MVQAQVGQGKAPPPAGLQGRLDPVQRRAVELVVGPGAPQARRALRAPDAVDPVRRRRVPARTIARGRPRCRAAGHARSPARRATGRSARRARPRRWRGASPGCDAGRLRRACGGWPGAVPAWPGWDAQQLDDGGVALEQIGRPVAGVVVERDDPVDVRDQVVEQSRDVLALVAHGDEGDQPDVPAADRETGGREGGQPHASSVPQGQDADDPELAVVLLSYANDATIVAAAASLLEQGVPLEIVVSHRRRGHAAAAGRRPPVADRACERSPSPTRGSAQHRRGGDARAMGGLPRRRLACCAWLGGCAARPSPRRCAGGRRRGCARLAGFSRGRRSSPAQQPAHAAHAAATGASALHGFVLARAARPGRSLSREPVVVRGHRDEQQADRQGRRDRLGPGGRAHHDLSAHGGRAVARADHARAPVGAVSPARSDGGSSVQCRR